MAFMDVHATGEAPAALTAPRGSQRVKPAHRPHPLALAVIALAALAAATLLATRFFDDRLLGALSAVLLYAVAAPIVARLGQASARRPRLSYQGMNHPTHRRG